MARFASHLTSSNLVRRTVLTALLATTVALPGAVLAEPLLPDGPGIGRFQNVDYISAERGAALDLGFTVLVPSWLPGPFGGEPSIDAGGGYYSLYWMNSGGSPTFLQVTGTVGGGLPAGSPYDLNVQLSINATVQGYAAVHDVTPAYDAVWWVAGGVLYKVESLNASADSVSIANSLIAFIPPTETEPMPEPTLPAEEPEEDPIIQEPEENSGGEPEAEVPVVEEPEVQEPEAEEPAEEAETEELSATEEPTAEDVADGGEESDSSADLEAGSDIEPTPDVQPTPTSVPSDGTGDPSVRSDGTGGPDVPATGSDGTGGTSDVIAWQPTRFRGESNP